MFKSLIIIRGKTQQDNAMRYPQNQKCFKISVKTADWDKIAAGYPSMFKTLKIRDKVEQDNVCNRISTKT
jgi:hypothetical protein